ncbi:MAG: gamma-glutamyl-gamma-aminobutyrate hydrolase family protein [Lachnospiraceae bacterium]|nr:gamma-glutamyl-gamma-aminobutyrate hydrolase family protein [Lachnospiraceae bacterium]
MKPLIGISCGIVHENGTEYHVLNSRYAEAVEKAGGIPLILPNPQDPSVMGELLGRVDGVILSGGPDLDPRLVEARADRSVSMISPKRDAAEIEMARRVVEEGGKPLLAICRGIQVLNVAMGGTLYVDLKTAGFPEHAFGGVYPRDGIAHTVRVREDSLLQELTGLSVLPVNSFHHQGIEKTAPGFVISAQSEPDGLAEEIELPGSRMVLGVQWHPEELTASEAHFALFQRLIREAEKEMKNSLKKR